jgi:malonyl-CoA O-methyltransferase
MTTPRMPVRTVDVARLFDRRPARIARHDFLLREVGRRLLSRLEYIRLQPEWVLDVGCGLGRSRADLLTIHPRARWIGVELSEAMARAGRQEQRGMMGLQRWWRGTPDWVVADGASLPFADNSIDLLFSNLMLHWHPTPHAVFPEWKRLLRVDGLLLFSCFGPDTLKELRAAARAVLPHAVPMPFVDMHDFGDMLVSSGFATPVMDAETLTLTYGDARQLLDEVRALGSNVQTDRWGALPAGRRARALLRALTEHSGADGRIPLTFEIAYGHAWKPQPHEVGVSSIPVDALRRQLSQRRR